MRTLSIAFVASLLLCSPALAGGEGWLHNLEQAKKKAKAENKDILIDFTGPDRAEVESYFLALQRGAGPDDVVRQVQLSGRYCDLFERREGEWRVLRRTVVYDWVDPQPVPDADEATRFGPRKPIGAPWPHDPVYRIGA